MGAKPSRKQPTAQGEHEEMTNCSLDHEIQGIGQSTTDHGDELHMADDISHFMKEVKRDFSDRPEVYNTFVNIMKTYHSTTAQTASQVSELFRGHPALLEKFNALLLPHYAMKHDSRRQRPEIPPSAYPDQIRLSLVNHPHVYDEVMVILKTFPHLIDTKVGRLSALGDHQPAWKGCLVAHLLPHHIVAEQPDGELIVLRRVPSQSAPPPSGVSFCNVNRQASLISQRQQALLQQVQQQIQKQWHLRAEYVELLRTCNSLIINTTNDIVKLLKPHTNLFKDMNAFLPSGCCLELQGPHQRDNPPHRYPTLHLPLGGSVSCAWNVKLLKLGCLAVEMVFPVTGLYRMDDVWVRNNKDKLRKLSEGESFWKVYGGNLTAGSRAEGLAMEVNWGHGLADRDIMWLCGGDLAVYVLPPGQQPPEDTTLVYTPQQCPPAYSCLQVLHEDRVMKAIIQCSRRSSYLFVSSPEVQKCVFSGGGRQWLHSRNTLGVMQLSGTQDISGPAGKELGGLLEYVHSLVCSGPHPAMASYKKRPRKHWPSPALLDTLMKQPMLLVMVGPKDTRYSCLMFRISWSPLELILLSNLFLWLKQGYVCFKYTVKSLLKSLRSSHSARDGRSQVGSYHLKTVFLRHLEEHPPRKEGSPFQLVLDLCQDLQYYLLMGCLPHYFLPECDLLQMVGDNERQCALQAVGQIIADPLVAILQSPSEPHVIYGYHSPHDLIRCFCVSYLPSSPERSDSLQWLLQHLDIHREELHRRQLKEDEGWVSGRPGLVRLADYLQ